MPVVIIARRILLCLFYFVNEIKLAVGKKQLAIHKILSWQVNVIVM